MTVDRTYSTREIAQMWNVSESTVKRWADSFGLNCLRTPGGHRRFRLQDIYEFQQRRAFEATGILSTEEWEDPNLEVWLNARNFARVRHLLVYLASQNQRYKIRSLLERLYLRGMRLEEIYDEVIVPGGKPLQNCSESELTAGQVLLVSTNLQDAMVQLAQKMIRRRPNGKTALCAASSSDSRIQVDTMARLLELEGWESLNLGDGVPVEVMSEVVETEPINLVCVYAEADPKVDCVRLNKVTQAYRIPVIVLSSANGVKSEFEHLDVEERFSSLQSLRSYISKIH
ncbi:MAG: helix-turn-helix domain-containing protein [Acidobacteriota bacterium]|nr:MAG: helix-turn-helix domain-containing protein [Acidobacteriota bacterium]